MNKYFILLTVLFLVGCASSVRWNEEAQRCQQIKAPYQFVDSSECVR